MTSNLVYRATTDDLDPPSGFVLKELAELSRRSIQDSDLIQTSLLSRLKKSAPNIKWKALKSIRYLCLHGRADVSRFFQRHHAAIRECGVYKGKIDNLHGDELNEKVRTSARETIEAVFAGPLHPNQQTTDLSSKIKGFSGGFQPQSQPPSKSTSFTSTFKIPNISFTTQPSTESPNYIPPIGTGKYMPGIGNTGYSAPKVQSSFNPPSGFTEYKEPIAYEGPSNQTEINPVPEIQKPRNATVKHRRKKGQVAGVWADETDEPTLDAKPKAPIDVNEGVEEQMVNDLTSGTGVKAVPPKSLLEKLELNFELIDHYLILSLLDEKLDETNKWQVQKKAMIVIETLCNRYLERCQDYFQENPDNLALLSESSVQSIQKKAIRLLGLLEVQVSEFKEDKTAETFAFKEIVDSKPTETSNMFANLTIAAEPSKESCTPVPQPEPQQEDFLLDFANATNVPQNGFEFIQSIKAKQQQPVQEFPFVAQAPSPAHQSIEQVPHRRGSKPQSVPSFDDPFASLATVSGKPRTSSTSSRSDKFEFVNDLLKN